VFERKPVTWPTGGWGRSLGPPQSSTLDLAGKRSPRDDRSDFTPMVAFTELELTNDVGEWWQEGSVFRSQPHEGFGGQTTQNAGRDRSPTSRTAPSPATCCGCRPIGERIDLFEVDFDSQAPDFRLRSEQVCQLRIS
jgi:hypothetical protein